MTPVGDTGVTITFVLTYALQLQYNSGMAKTPKTFRLSEQAINHLKEIASQTGSNDTAIIEMALAHFASIMQSQNQVKPVSFPEQLPPDFWETEQAPVNFVNTQKDQKQRHRHKSKSKR